MSIRSLSAFTGSCPDRSAQRIHVNPPCFFSRVEATRPTASRTMRRSDQSSARRRNHTVRSTDCMSSHPLSGSSRGRRRSASSRSASSPTRAVSISSVEGGGTSGVGNRTSRASFSCTKVGKRVSGGMPSCSRVPGEGSPSWASRSSQASHHSRESVRSRAAVSSEKSGSRPASRGRSRRRRAQKAWIVPMKPRSIPRSAAWSRSSSAVPEAARAASSSAFWNRSLSSPAAFRVKVTATRDSTGTPVRTRATIRPTSAVVLPDPAPASTRRLISRSPPIRARAAASGRLIRPPPTVAGRRASDRRGRRAPGPPHRTRPRASGPRRSRRRGPGRPA